MANLEVSRVVYPPAHGEGPIVVERLVPAQLTEETVWGLIDLTHVAFAGQFGTSDPSVTPSMLTNAAARERIYRNKIISLQQATANGARRWVVRGESEAPGEFFEGYAQVVPTANGLELTDVQARPPFRRGYGSALLHAALTADEWDLDQRLKLSGFSGSSVNNFYRSIGMVEIEPEGKGFVGFATPPGFGIRGVVAVLEQRRPHLAQAQRL